MPCPAGITQDSIEQARALPELHMLEDIRNLLQAGNGLAHFIYGIDAFLRIGRMTRTAQ